MLVALRLRIRQPSAAHRGRTAPAQASERRSLTRALVSLPESDWQMVFRADVLPDASGESPEEGDEFAGTTNGTNDVEDDADDGQLDFRTYVARIRSGMAEYGREAAVPRPRP